MTTTMRSLATAALRAATVLATVLCLASPARAIVDDRLMANPTTQVWLVKKTEAEIKSVLDEGYRIVEMEVESVSPLVKLTVALVKNEGPYAKAWWWHPSLSSSEVGQWLKDFGARLTLLKPMKLPDGTIRYAVVMVSNTGQDFANWSWFPNATLSQITQTANDLGDRIVDIESFVNKLGKRRYTAITVNNQGANYKGTAVFAGWTLSAMAAWLKDYPSLMLTDLERIDANNYVAIATQVGGAARWTFVGVTGQQVNNLLGRYWARPIDIEPYQVNGKRRYAILMRDNGQGTTGGTRPGFAPFDNALRKVMKKHGIPGGSLALVKDGKLIYARGYGFADIENQILASPTTVFRIGNLPFPWFDN